MPVYEPNPKHKRWRHPFDPDATQCPVWSHQRAQALLDESISVPNEARRFATAEGMAFVARTTREDIWHGYPVPWSSVPEPVRRRMLADGKVTRRQMRRLFSASSLADELDP